MRVVVGIGRLTALSNLLLDNALVIPIIFVNQFLYFSIHRPELVLGLLTLIPVIYSVDKDIIQQLQGPMNNILVLLDQTNVDDINGNVYILGRQINQGEKTLEDLKLMFGRLVQQQECQAVGDGLELGVGEHVCITLLAYFSEKHTYSVQLLLVQLGFLAMLFTFANFMVTLFDSVERMNHEGDDWIRIEFSIVLRCQFQYNTYQHTILTLLLPIFVHFGISFLFVALSRIGFIDHVDNLVYNLTPVVLVSSYFLFHIFRYVLVSYSQLSILLLLLLLSMSLKHVTDKYVPLFLYQLLTLYFDCLSLQLFCLTNLLDTDAHSLTVLLLLLLPQVDHDCIQQLNWVHQILDVLYMPPRFATSLAVEYEGIDARYGVRVLEDVSEEQRVGHSQDCDSLHVQNGQLFYIFDCDQKRVWLCIKVHMIKAVRYDLKHITDVTYLHQYSAKLLMCYRVVTARIIGLFGLACLQDLGVECG